MGNSTYGNNRAEVASNTAHQLSDGIDHSIVNAITTFAKTLLDDVTAAAMRTTLGAAASGSNSDITALTALTNITPGANFTITQNSIIPFRSVESGAVVNTLELQNGKVTTKDCTVKGVLDIKDSAGSNKSKTILESTNTQNISTLQAIGIFSSGYGGFAVIVGSEGDTNRFNDILHVGRGAVTVISSKNVLGSPAVRTYSMTVTSLELTMASGSYDVTVFEIESLSPL